MVGGLPDQEFNRGTTRNSQPAIDTPDILIDGGGVHAVITAVRVDPLIRPDRDIGSGFDSCRCPWAGTQRKFAGAPAIHPDRAVSESPGVAFDTGSGVLVLPGQANSAPRIRIARNSASIRDATNTAVIPLSILGMSYERKHERQG
jgi:hypothetical protein